jgi:hypothetical protein
MTSFKIKQNGGIINLVAEHSYFDKKKPNKWMVGVRINISITWVHPQSTHAI